MKLKEKIEYINLKKMYSFFRIKYKYIMVVMVYL